MKYLLAALLWLGWTIPQTTTVPERPAVNIPVACRQSNWTSYGSGSCVHATMISLFRWQGRLHTADYWRRTYGGGEDPSGLSTKFDREGIRYAYVTTGEVAFLEWACRTRRGCLRRRKVTGWLAERLPPGRPLQD